jgi:hypothetical protein
MKSAVVEFWSETECLARADAIEVERLPAGNPTHIVFCANALFTKSGRPVKVKYFCGGVEHSIVDIQVGGAPNPSVAIFPKAEFSAGEIMTTYAFAGAISDFDPPAELELKAGAGTVDFTIEVFDPNTGETQVHHCTGSVH